MIYFDTYASALGPLLLTGTERALTGISFGGNEDPELVAAPPEMFKLVKLWLDDYFCGTVRAVDFPVAPEGTEFQKLVWRRLGKIPFGQTRTYGQIAGELAVLLGKKRMSPQAVGQAVGKNPLAIIVPCHRVVGAGGSLTGYAWGLEYKAWLLCHEGRITKQNRDTDR